MAESTDSNQRETHQTPKGVLQGSPLSPLRSNIMLNELDKEMERQGLRHVRYANDFSVYTKSNTAPRKIGNSIFLFLKDKLKQPINREKSGIRKPMNFKVLGYGFAPTYLRRQRQIPVGSQRKELKIAQREAENSHPGNHPDELQRTHPEAQRSYPRLAQLLLNGKYSRQTEGTGRMSQKPAKALHLASLEKKPNGKGKT